MNESWMETGHIGPGPWWGCPSYDPRRRPLVIPRRLLFYRGKSPDQSSEPSMGEPMSAAGNMCNRRDAISRGLSSSGVPGDQHKRIHADDRRDNDETGAQRDSVGSIRGGIARADHDKVVALDGGARGLEGSWSDGVPPAGRTDTTSSATLSIGIAVENSTGSCPCTTNWQIRQLSAASRRD